MVKRESGGTPSAPSTAKAARIQEDLAKTLSRFVMNACKGEARSSASVGEINGLRYTMPYVSQTALASIIRYSKDHGGLPSSAADRREIRHARDVTTIKNETPYGPLHRSVQMALSGAGGETSVEIQDPWAMLYCSSSESGWFSALLQYTLEKHPCSPSHPWHIVLYSDEVTPGNALAARNDRKAQCIYWSIWEFGPYLSDESVWFTLAVLKSKAAKMLQQDLSSLMGMAAEQFFPVDKQRCMQTRGINITTGESLIHLRFQVGFVVEDELAIHMTYMSMGVNGLKSCILCCTNFNGIQGKGWGRRWWEGKSASD